MTTKSRTLGKTFAGQLGTLKRDKRYTVQQFADLIGAKINTVRDWLNARVLPRAEHLHAIAKHFGITTDWLLGIEGAPKHPGQYRTNAKIEDDLAARVAREALAKAGSGIDPKLREEFESKLCGSALLRFCVDMAAEDVLARAPYYRGLRAGLSARARIGVAAMRLKRGGLAEVAADVKDALASLERHLDAPPPAGKVVSWQPVSSTPAKRSSRR